MRKKIIFTVLILFVLFLTIAGSAFAMTNFQSPDLWESVDYTIYADSAHYTMAGISYGPENLKDYDPNTAWVEGAPGYGYGQGLTIYPGHKMYFHGFAFHNGYNKSTKARNENGAVYSFDFYVNDQFVDTIYLSDSTSWQYYTHLTGFNLTPQDKIRLVITDVYVGPWDDEQDTALSGLLLLYDHYREPQPTPQPTQQSAQVNVDETVNQPATDELAQEVMKPKETQSKNATIEIRSLIAIVSVIIAVAALVTSFVILLRARKNKGTDDKNDPFEG